MRVGGGGGDHYSPATSGGHNFHTGAPIDAPFAARRSSRHPLRFYHNIEVWVSSFPYVSIVNVLGEHSQQIPKKLTNSGMQQDEGRKERSAMSSCISLLPAPDDYLGSSPSMVHHCRMSWASATQSSHVPSARTCSQVPSARTGGTPKIPSARTGGKCTIGTLNSHGEDPVTNKLS
ncbi:hypothetical protein PIB30_050023 [Stylosanthes scabra]|uniref:Uncharacterized protein n=1 Tax=Stylosanthes scabra TaxID=79078 RepID=A0ABU6WFJ8_9FABA|nr:hypothetical protein [Stylosanthes scabra]